MATLRIGITGAAGLLGWHARCRLHTVANCETIPATHETFASATLLDEFVESCDAILHFAGMNRGDPGEIERINPALARGLVAALRRRGVQPHLLYASSIHRQADTPYGRSKRIAGEIFGEWAAATRARYTEMVLPHVFGEHGKPFYNSVVATFCHQLAHGEAPRIESDSTLELLHAQEVAVLAQEVLSAATTGSVRPAGQRITVTELLERLREMASQYLSGVIPRFEEPLDLRLFNTFRSYLYPQHYPVELTLRSDPRGTLFEAVKTDHGGQAFLSTTKPGIARGNHFHFEKIERFLVVKGQAVIRLRRLFDSRVDEFQVSGERPVFVDMPTLHTHSITNTGNGELLTLFWAHEVFDPARPDTYAEPV